MNCIFTSTYLPYYVSLGEFVPSTFKRGTIDTCVLNIFKIIFLDTTPFITFWKDVMEYVKQDLHKEDVFYIARLKIRYMI